MERVNTWSNWRRRGRVGLCGFDDDDDDDDDERLVALLFADIVVGLTHSSPIASISEGGSESCSNCC